MLIPKDKRQMAISLINEAVEAGARCFKACAILRLSIRTFKRWTKDKKLEDQRQFSQHKPANKLSLSERNQLLKVCNSGEYASLPPSQIVPMLADKGVYIASESTFYRVLRDEKQLYHRGRARMRKNIVKPNAYAATSANQVWSWDITYLAANIKGMFYRLYLILDVYSRKIVGWEVHESETSEHASILMKKTCLAENIAQSALVLHSDNGSPMKGATMLGMLQNLGVVPSFSRPSVSNDNPYSESLFRTLKYTPAYPSKPFESLDKARAWVLEFVQWYNHEHHHSMIQFVTPVQRHLGEDIAILKQRKKVYETAKKLNPKRWSGSTRNWNHQAVTHLNPTNETQCENDKNIKPK